MKSLLLLLALALLAAAQTLQQWETCSLACGSDIDTCLKDKTCNGIYEKCSKQSKILQCLGRANSFYSNRILKCSVAKCNIDL